MTDFSLDRLNVNDDEHLIRNWLVADGELVAVGRPIAEVETSKATVEIEARGSGPLRILKPAGANVRVGETIYAIDDGDNANVGAANHLTAGPLPTRPETGADRAEPDPQHAGTVSTNAERGFVTRRPILRPTRSTVGSNSAAQANASGPLQGVDARKLAEIQSLSVVNPSGLVSCLFVDVNLGARSIPQHGVFASNISDLICYESARAISTFPLLSAFFCPEQGIKRYDRTRIGYTIDSNDDLIVYNIGECQSLTLEQVRERISACIEAHVLNKRSASMLEPTTFTVADLSGAGVSGFVPLINGRQSAILGYSHPSPVVARLTLAFDHRVMSGRYAANFLGDLRSRIECHLTGGSQAACYFCGRDGAALRQLQHLGLFKIVDTDGQERLACLLCMGGF
jgi:pyruvate/2-oxoglutarate dehydrogenase complex dihydrolipoamide acyltransferase (E2) component